MSFFRRRRNHNDAQQPQQQPVSPQFHSQVEHLIPAEFRMISGCHSEQTSADVSNVQSVASQLPNPAGKAGGACTSALLEILYQHKTTGITFQKLLLELRQSLQRKGMDQIPQLSSSRPLELQQTPFSLTNGPGQKRALLVGINYRGQNGELRGCHNDVLNVKRYLMAHHGYDESQILVLMDDGGRHIYPTRQKIILGLQQLVAQSQPGDNVFFHYSGHGGLLSPDGFNAFKMGGGNPGKEYDETLYPVDHSSAGQIRDFSLFNHFVKPMRAGVTATCILDCCHSGTVLDLPYQFQPTPGGEIQMRSSMDTLSNLAFLYVLAGGGSDLMHAGLFHNVFAHMDRNVDGNLDDYHGTGTDELYNNDMTDDAEFTTEAAQYYDDCNDEDYDAEAAAVALGDDGGGVAEDGGDFAEAAADPYGGAAADGEPLVVQGEPVDDAYGGEEPVVVEPYVADDYGGGVTEEEAPPDAGGGWGGWGGGEDYGDASGEAEPVVVQGEPMMGGGLYDDAGAGGGGGGDFWGGGEDYGGGGDDYGDFADRGGGDADCCDICGDILNAVAEAADDD